MASKEPTAPSLLTTAGESLAPIEFLRLIAHSPRLLRQKKGNREPVIVLPGLGASNISTSILRNYLSWLNYHVTGWSIGRNIGNVNAMVPAVKTQLREIYQEHQTKVNLIGWSLGGIVAREVARDIPELVSQIITLGSPIIGGPKYTSFASFYIQQGYDLDELETRIRERQKKAIDVPITAIYSKRDGVVAWHACMDQQHKQADNIEVSATHLGLGVSPEVLEIVAKKLSTL